MKVDLPSTKARTITEEQMTHHATACKHFIICSTAFLMTFGLNNCNLMQITFYFNIFCLKFIEDLMNINTK